MTPAAPAGSPATLTEAELQTALVNLARTCGWRVAHFRPALTKKGWRTPMQGDAGYPDLTLVHPKTKRLLFIELKSDKGRTTVDQDAWLEALTSSKAPLVMTWRPEDVDHAAALLVELSRS